MYEIRGGKPDKADFTFYGQARDFVVYRGREAILHGPAETGKTISVLNYLHICACKYPKAQIVIARKTLASCIGSVLQTFQNKVLDDNAPVEPPYGGSKPEWFDYKNGSRIWVTGFDKQSKALSTERDIIYVNQCEELDLGDWETATTRTTGRAGNMPYGRVIGDANPSYPQHWMYHRQAIKIFYSFHRDNPMLYNPLTGEITEQGKITIATLEALTGVRRKRLYEGKPAQAEGVVYDEWDEAIHYVYDDNLPVFVRHIAGVDWGFTHPGVIGVFGVTGDGAMYLVAQIFRTGETIDWWVEQAVSLRNEFKVETFVCDPSEPAYIEAFRLAGLRAIEANNTVLPGINAVKQRLKDRRFFVVRDRGRFTDTKLAEARRPYLVEHEFPSYVWASSKTKEQPVKEMDDGMDMSRYAVMYVDRPIGVLFG